MKFSKIALCILIIFSSRISYSIDSIAQISDVKHPFKLKVHPISLIFKRFNVGFEQGITQNLSIGLEGIYKNKETYTNYSYAEKRLNLHTTYYSKSMITDSYYASYILSYEDSSTSYNLNEHLTTPYSAKGVSNSIAAGHTWIWDSGINLKLGFEYRMMLGSSEIVVQNKKQNYETRMIFSLGYYIV